MRHPVRFTRAAALLGTLLVPRAGLAAATALTDYAKHEAQGRGWLVTTDSGQTLRITPYGDAMVRVQAAPSGQAFVADDRYAMVQSHAWMGSLAATDEGSAIKLVSPGGVEVRITKSPVRVQISANGAPMVEESLTGGLVTGDRPLEVKVNGTPLAAPLSFPVTGAWTRWSTVAVNAQLNAGSNLIRAGAIGVSDHFTTGQRTLTAMTYDDASFRLKVEADDGTYPGAPTMRSYRARFHGVSAARPMQLNGQPLTTFATEGEATKAGGVVWDAAKHTLLVATPPLPVNAKVVIDPLGSVENPGADAGALPGSDGGASPPDAAGPPPAGTSDGGCGCHAAPAPLPKGLLAILFSTLGAFAIRRRRR